MKIILLNNIRSMQNVGAIFRNCDGAGFDKVILTGCCPYPPRGEISKTALGSEDSIIWEYYSDPVKALVELKKEKYYVVSVELTQESKDFRILREGIPDKTCLIVGNEVNGIQQDLLELSDEFVMIPMLGIKESLNVSVAAGIIMYECLSLPGE